jgi:hypothetical protein
MRALLASLLFVVACGPKVAPKTSAFDEEALAEDKPVANVEPAAQPARPEAPPGKGLRSGTIERASLIAVLDKGPGAFLRQFEVTPRMDGGRFVGWQLVQLLDPQSPLRDVDVVPKDVLLAVNDKPISRPDQLQTVWDSLRTANEVRALVWRGDAKLELAFTIEPAVDAAASATAPVPPSK